MSPSSPASDPASDMPRIQINASRALTLTESYKSVLQSIATSSPRPPPRLVCVSKLKPASDILALHSPSDWLTQLPFAEHTAAKNNLPEPALHFGENYVQELLEKSKILPGTVRWHFIGGLQSNKALQLARDVHGLWAVESVDTIKKATLLNEGKSQGRAKSNNDHQRLRVFIQVNTSGEESKSGVVPRLPEPMPEYLAVHDREALKEYPLLALAAHIQGSCPTLHLQGLMTIGALARSQATTPETENEDFIALREARDRLETLLSLEQGSLELSMGMSNDYKAAIRQGSNEVRVGSTIFGERPPKKEAKVLENMEGQQK